MRKWWIGIVTCLLVLTSCAPTADRDHLDAFTTIVAWFYGDEPSAARVFAIDAASTGLPDPSLLVDALRADPRYAGHDIVDATREQLEAQGLIKDLQFEDGFLIEFFSASAHGNQVTARGQIWWSGLGANTATLTARWNGREWVLDEPKVEAVA